MHTFQGRNHGRFALLLATLCATVSVCERAYAAGPDARSALLDKKQAAHRLLVQPKPEYPGVAKVNYLQGCVYLQLVVDDNGNVADTHVLAGDAVLAASALKAARRWVYRPLTTPAGPQGFVTRVKLKYWLSNTVADLPPRRAEKDFLRQVKLPEALPPPAETPSGDIVHLRLLVDDQGRVDDVQAMPAGRAELDAPRESLRGWSFRPAHWGNLPVASYLDVDVPVSPSSLARANPKAALVRSFR